MFRCGSENDYKQLKYIEPRIPRMEAPSQNSLYIWKTKHIDHTFEMNRSR